MLKNYKIKYRGYWGNNVGYSLIEADSPQSAKAQVRWGFILDCYEVIWQERWKEWKRVWS